MTATPSIDLPGWMAEQLSQASPDLLRNMIQTLAGALMSANADGCRRGLGHPSRVACTPSSDIGRTELESAGLVAGDECGSLVAVGGPQAIPPDAFAATVRS